LNVAPPVTVVIAGRRIDAAASARLERGVVVGPLVPFVREIADEIDGDGSGRRFVARRGSRSIAFTLAAEQPSNPDGIEPLAPLAPIARALGATVDYDAASRTLSIVLVPTPLVTMTPIAHYMPPPTPLATFTAKPAPEPQATVTGIPHPRRTPLVESNPTPAP